MANKELLLTINYSFTYEVAVKTDVDPELIKGYPKTKLPARLLNIIESTIHTKQGELVDSSIAVDEVVDVDKELWTV